MFKHCPNCGQEVYVAFNDFDIGSYEYWGAKGVHKDVRACCEVCDYIFDDSEIYDDAIDDAYYDTLDEKFL